MRVLVALMALAALVLAGCVTPGSLLSTSSVAPLKLDLLAATDSLWPDHQNEPHPSYGWPTLTHPATGAEVPALWKPIPAANVTKIAGLKHVAQSTKDVKTGAGVALFGSLAVLPGFSKENYVIDISEPTVPKVLGKWEGSERGAAVMAFPDGRLYGVISTDAGIDVVNLTDPTHPEIVSQIKPKTGGHKVGVVPGTPIVYNANSAGGGTTSFTGQGGAGQTEIYDLTDPAAPVLVQEFKNGFGCHHIFFWNDASQDKHRALCAGIEYTQIWDIKDPKAPKVIVSIPVPHGNPALPSMSAPNALPLMFSHTAFLNQNGNILIVGDELMGGGPAACDGVHTPVADKSGPLGNLWFYDIKDEKNPKLLGWFSPPPSQATDPRAPNADPTNPSGTVFRTPGCTAHHGRIVSDPEGKKQLLVMAWYSAGVVLVDFTDPTSPKLVDEWNPGANTWETWYYNGYVFTGDLNRGLDVLTFK
ncbi:MAG: hypothetical protein WDA16_14770 [Candidatus Thermoplasmatota archaeon]